MAVHAFLTGTYARNIYIYGTRSFSTITTEYHQPIKQYASDSFTVGQIQEALTKDYITQQEYDETIALVGDDPFVPNTTSKDEV